MTSPLLVVSSFPDRGEIHSAQTVGVASYAKNILLALSRLEPQREIEIWAEKLPGYRDYREGKLRVRRRWQRGNIPSLIKLCINLIGNKRSQILLEFEINEFGDPLTTGTFILALIVARLAGVRLTLVMHQVLGNFRDLEHKKLSTYLKNIAKSMFYVMIKLACSRIIVFEGQLKANLGADRKIAVVAHYVTPAPAVDRSAARKRLGWSATEQIILCFGYIAPYKGIKELLEIWPTKLTGTRLVIAGGASPNHAADPVSQAYVAAVERLAAAKNITITGFVPEAEMPNYFAGCDAMIFPYRTFMSSSGPLAFAFSYGRPVILAPPLAAYAQSPDFAAMLIARNLTIDDLTYTDTKAGLRAKLKNLSKKSERLREFSRSMAEVRSIDKIAAQTRAQLVTP